MDLSIILPAYNEELNIKRVIEEIIEAAGGELGNLDYEIIIVNDGSCDNTAKTVAGFCRDYGFVILIDLKKHRGYGSALIEGFKRSKGRYIFYCDSDGQFQYSEINKFINLITTEKYDMISGWRIERKDTYFRKLLSGFYNRIINQIFNLSYKDINCGFKIFDRNIIKNMNLLSSSFSLSAELMIKSSIYNYSVKELAVTHLPRTDGMSSVNFIQTYLMIKDLLKVWLRLRG